MNINEFFKLESDTLNVTLSHRKAGKKNWIPIGYFCNPHNALEYLVKYEIMGASMTDIKTICQKIDELTALVNSLKLPSDIVQCLPRPAKDETGGKHRYQAVTA